MKELLFVSNFEVAVKYFRTQSRMESDGICCYGIYVEKYVGDELTEEGHSGFISENEGYVNCLLARLSEGLVMPSSLNEILDEIY
ncbi:MAG: DUF6514 family protein [Defluviitaleaceae bacterium]|nr:DUF6514 family protein [Defluviitaleaceae bacterium]